MPVIAPQHTNDPWRPLCAWPDDAYVQWGGRGVVFSKTDSYLTAFFEAFPRDNTAGFLRGKGETIAAAEANAFAQWQRFRACADAGGHRWSRVRRLSNGKTSTYTNGGCFCLNCHAFQTVMAPLVVLGAYKKPLSASELDLIALGACRPDADTDPEHAKWKRKLMLRAKVAGLDLPPISPRPKHTKPFDQDAYERACRQAVKTFLRDRPIPAADDVDFMSGLTRASLRHLVEEEDDGDAPK